MKPRNESLLALVNRITETQQDLLDRVTRAEGRITELETQTRRDDAPAAAELWQPLAETMPRAFEDGV